ncbi:MAG TPA: hypothetical protein VGH80_09235 [Xanthomonadaceae bacterium]|jgi:hypothetical protein
MLACGIAGEAVMLFLLWSTLGYPAFPKLVEFLLKPNAWILVGGFGAMIGCVFHAVIEFARRYRAFRDDQQQRRTESPDTMMK